MKQSTRNILFRVVVLIVGMVVFPLMSQGQLRFIENKGQWHEKVLLKAQINGGFLFLEEDGYTFTFYDSEALTKYHETRHIPDSIKMHSLKVRFKGAQKPSSVIKSLPEDGHYNYFLDNDKSKWATRCKAFNNVILKDVYPNIDFEFYEMGGSLKYNFIVNEGGKIKDIALEYLGADKIRLDGGKLKIQTSIRDMEELAPYVYQGNANEEIASAYDLDGNVLRFIVSGKYSRRSKLVIDPKLVFSTYSGSKADNFGYTATYDHDGNAYAGGSVFEAGFTLSSGAYMANFQDSNSSSLMQYRIDAGILKFTSDGTKLVYGTYLGGRFGGDHPHSMVVDTNGYLVIFGSTNSSFFPISSNAVFDDSYNGEADIFLAKLNHDGTQLLSSTFVGGEGLDGQNGYDYSFKESPGTATNFNYADQFRGEVIVDEFNDIYVISSSRSVMFPRVNDNNLPRPQQNAVAFKMTGDMETMLWSKFLGGSGNDAGFGLDFGKQGDLYVTGGTSSKDFLPVLNGINKNNHGGVDGWLIRLNRDIGTYMSGTFLGTPFYDQSYFVKTDQSGFPFVYGQTLGNMPISPNTYGINGSTMFIQKYGVDLKSYRLGTVFGNGTKSGMISPTAFLVDVCDVIYVSGWGGETNEQGNTLNFPVMDAPQSTTDGSDFYLAAFDKDMEGLLFGTYFGGNNSQHAEHVDGGTSRFDPNGIIYQSVCASCDAVNVFPTTPGAFSTTNKGKRPGRTVPGCNNAIFKIDFELVNKKPQATDSFYSVIATDVLNFDITVTDPDKEDVLQMTVDGDPFPTGTLAPPHAVVTTNTGVSPLTNTFSWQTSCDHISEDTIEVNVKVLDHGCPDMDSNFATIKIVVKPPPLVELPDYLCIKLLDDNSLEVWWEDIPTDKYFKQLFLYKISPTGDTSLVSTYNSGVASKYLDKNVNRPKLNNYCYFLKATNICDMESEMSYPTCTTVELNSPITATEVITATVVDDKGVKVRWQKSLEADFNSYDIYRQDSRNLTKPTNYVYIASVMDVNTLEYIDYNIDVDKESFCYRVVITDKCGHVSYPSNRGCNIVLTGESIPWKFNLEWQDYSHWRNGVREFELKRSVDTGSLRPIVRVDYPTMSYTDGDLNYDWGGYYYQVTAFESDIVPDSSNNAESVSNTIYLVQPPHLYVPSAFTPNEDNLNDNWGIVPVFVKEYHIEVFNRWGEKVYESTEKKKQWHGEFHKKETPFQNVFIWQVRYTGWDGSVHYDRGDVTILK